MFIPQEIYVCRSVFLLVILTEITGSTFYPLILKDDEMIYCLHNKHTYKMFFKTLYLFTIKNILSRCRAEK